MSSRMTLMRRTPPTRSASHCRARALAWSSRRKTNRKPNRSSPTGVRDCAGPGARLSEGPDDIVPPPLDPRPVSGLAWRTWYEARRMKFGQYELLELIAVGGMAEVFKGRVVAAEGFEKLVAIKRILPDLAEDERFVKMLLTEARIHSALSHRNIVQIHDLGISEDGQYFIVLEYVEGYDLRMITEQLAAEGEIIPEVLSLHIASELAQGLHFAHELKGEDGQALGLIHRDVTPSNVLISLAGEVKLSDFGLAKRRHDRSVVGSLKGNLSYMSPEQAMQRPLDRRTDVFSLGAVLFEMLTGKRLREIRDEIAAWNHVASGQ